MIRVYCGSEPVGPPIGMTFGSEVEADPLTEAEAEAERKRAVARRYGAVV